jgi:hypothetical protein
MVGWGLVFVCFVPFVVNQSLDLDLRRGARATLD